MKEKAVIFIHGFLGSSTQFAPFTEAVKAAGAQPVLLTLPGHGADLAAFCKSGRRDWEAFVLSGVESCAKEYGEVYLVGHSMGGLLAMHAALRFPESVKGILAISLPLSVRITPRTVSILAGSVRKRETQDPYVLAARQFGGVGGITFFNSPLLLKNTFGLLHMMRTGRKRLPHLPVPLTVFNSEKDEIVSPRAAAFVKKRLPAAKLCLLAESGHFYFTADETARIGRAVLSLMGEVHA